MYLLRKWYFDLLTPGGTYLFLYFAYIRLAAAKMYSLVLHIAPGDSAKTHTFPLPVKSLREGGKEGHEFLALLKDGAITLDRNGCRITVKHPRSSVDLSYSPVIPGGTGPVLIPGDGGHILWEPIGIRYRVEGLVTLDGLRLDVSGSAGYADFLESTILPPRVPVRRLLWGRAHHAGADLTFMHASGTGGFPSWSRLILHRGGKIEESKGIEIVRAGEQEGSPAKASDEYTLRARLPDTELLINVRRRKLVQCSSFIDQQNIRWTIARSLVKKFTRDPRGSKYLSCIDVPGWEANGQGSFMIDEEAYL